MWNDTESLEMLTVFHISSFLMLNYIGDIKSIVFYNPSGEMYCDLSFGKFDL